MTFILGLITGLILSGFFYGLIWLAVCESESGSEAEKEDCLKAYEEYCKPQIKGE